MRTHDWHLRRTCAVIIIYCQFLNGVNFNCCPGDASTTSRTRRPEDAAASTSADQGSSASLTARAEPAAPASTTTPGVSEGAAGQKGRGRKPKRNLKEDPLKDNEMILGKRWPTPPNLKTKKFPRSSECRSVRRNTLLIAYKKLATRCSI